MIGFIIGFACLWGLVRVIRGRGHDCGPGRRWRSERSRRGPRSMLRFLFERLDTTPAQEREISHAVDDFVDAAHALKGELRKTRGDVGRAFRGDALDDEVLGSAFVRQDDAIGQARTSFIELLARVHAVLDEEQRKRLARWLERRGGGWGGPYRAWSY